MGLLYSVTVATTLALDTPVSSDNNRRAKRLRHRHRLSHCALALLTEPR
jgi:hypothetical protein